MAVSCLADIDPANVLPPLTAYYVMRIGTLPLVPYFPPGDLDLAKAVKEMASRHHAVLLANHGPVVAGKSLEDARLCHGGAGRDGAPVPDACATPAPVP